MYRDLETYDTYRYIMCKHKKSISVSIPDFVKQILF